MDDMESRRLYFACDGTYFYSFGPTNLDQFNYGKSTDLFSLFDSYVGVSSNYETITIMSDNTLTNSIFIESKNGKVYYIGRMSTNKYFLFVTIINGVATINKDFFMRDLLMWKVI